MVAMSPELGVATELRRGAEVVWLLLCRGPWDACPIRPRRSPPTAHRRCQPAVRAPPRLLLVMALVVPLAGAAVIGALTATLTQAGGLALRAPRSAWGGEALKQRLGRMLPSPGAARRLAGAALKLAALAGVACLTLWGALPSLLELSGVGPWQLLAHAQGLGLKLAARLSLVLVVIAVADAARARWAHRRGLRMSKRELRDELRLDEGDPRLQVAPARARSRAAGAEREGVLDDQGHPVHGSRRSTGAARLLAAASGGRWDCVVVVVVPMAPVGSGRADLSRPGAVTGRAAGGAQRVGSPRPECPSRPCCSCSPSTGSPSTSPPPGSSC